MHVLYDRLGKAINLETGVTSHTIALGTLNMAITLVQSLEIYEGISHIVSNKMLHMYLYAYNYFLCLLSSVIKLCFLSSRVWLIPEKLFCRGGEARFLESHILIGVLSLPRCMGVGGGVLPIMAYTWRLRLKGVPFSAFPVYKRVWISQVEVYKRVGKSVI